MDHRNCTSRVDTHSEPQFGHCCHKQIIRSKHHENHLVGPDFGY